MARVKIGDYGNMDDAQRQGIDEIEYDGGQIGRKVQGGWQYDWRPQAYTDALGQHDIQGQQGLGAFRDAAARQGIHVDEGDANASQAMQHYQQTGQFQGVPLDPSAGHQLPKNASPAQQWNAQPSPSQAPPSAPAAAPGSQYQQLIDQLMARAQQGLNVNANDPVISQQAAAYSANQERARRNYLSDTAEQMGPGANIQGERRMAAERMGQNTGAFEAELISREVGARRDEIQQALSQWGALLSNEQRMGLERELAQLNDRARTADREMADRQQTASLGLSREGLYMGDRQRTADRNSQMEQFLRELALREWQAGNDNDWRWAQF